MSLTPKEIQTIDNPYERNDAWAVHYANLSASTSNPQEAIQYAKQSFAHSAFLFEVHPDFIELGLQAGDLEFCQELASWHFYMFELHQDDASLERIKALLSQSKFADNFKQFFLRLQTERYEEEYNDGHINFEEYLILLQQLKEQGLPDGDVLVYKTYVLFQEGDFESILALWTNEELNKIDPKWTMTFCKVIHLRILHGHSTDGIEFPNNNNAVNLYNCVTVLNEFLENALDNWYENKSDENYKIFVHLAEFGNAVGERCVALFTQFENGELNGYSNAPHFYAMLCQNYGLLLNKMANFYDDKTYYAKALELRWHGCYLSPDFYILESITDNALEVGDVEKWQWANDTMHREYSDYFGIEEIQRNQRYQVWASGLTGDLDKFWQAYDKFWQNNQDLIRVGRIAHNGDFIFASDAFKWQEEVAYFRAFATNCIIKGLEPLVEKYSNHLDVIGAMIHHQSYQGKNDEGNWGINNQHLLSLFENAKSKEERKWAFRAYSGMGYMVTRTAIMDEIGEIADGIALMEKANEFADAEDEVYYLANHYLSLGRYIYYNTEDYQKALEYLQKAIEISPPSPILPDEVLADLTLGNELAMSELPDTILGLSHYYLGYTKMALQYPQAEIIEHFEKSYPLLPTIDGVWYELAIYYSNIANKQDKALMFIELYLNKYNDDNDEEHKSEIALLLAKKMLILIEQNKKEEAKVVFARYEEHYTDFDPDIYRSLCKVLKDRKKLFGLF